MQHLHIKKKKITISAIFYNFNYKMNTTLFKIEDTAPRSVYYYINIFLNKIYLQVWVAIGIISNFIVLFVIVANKRFKEDNSVKVRQYYLTFAITDLIIIFSYFFIGAFRMHFTY